jgi:hypothetical protein
VPGINSRNVFWTKEKRHDGIFPTCYVSVFCQAVIREPWLDNFRDEESYVGFEVLTVADT